MKQSKFEVLRAVSRLRLFRVGMILFVLYLLLMSLEIPIVLKHEEDTQDRYPITFDQGVDTADGSASFPNRYSRHVSGRRMREYKKVSVLVFDEMPFVNGSRDEFSELHKTAASAFSVGRNLWKELESGKIRIELNNKAENLSESCVHSIVMRGQEFRRHGRIMVIPCGLTLGSHVSVVGKPYWAHPEYEPQIALLREGEKSLMVSQFILELQGLKTVDGEDPPRILHFNPRLKGDFSGRPVIEQNTCYRMQWGSALRCVGWKSMADEETVDGEVKCEKWIRDDDNHSEESKTTWWLNKLIGRKTKVTVDWPFPFVEDKLFVLTLTAGLEGYHISVDGRHVTSFPHRTRFSLEDATGLFIKGDVYVHSIFAASLPTSHPSFAPQRHLEMLTKWQAPLLPVKPVQLFIGILSAGNHFSERMAVRKSWMQHQLIKSLNVVARFFVALHGRQEVNLELMKEAEFFGDIVIVSYMDNYDLVVLKTVAICEFGIREVAANYIMKCDDDTFVRIDVVMKEVKKIRQDRSLYMGNINYYHRPLRHGKWAVTYEEWPEEEYPPYANGPGYVVSYDIAKYIVSNFERHDLRLFKMEDVSMGMWVELFNKSKPVEYVHSVKFCQFGCIEDYFTAHYQSPKQMICLWDRLQYQGTPTCCNMR